MDEETLIREVSQPHGQATQPPQPDPPTNSNDGFQNIPNANEAPGGYGSPNQTSKAVSSPKITPFSDEEIVSGVAFTSALALAKGNIITQPHHEMIYQEAFNKFVPLQTSALIAPLKLGDALTRYGIGHGMTPGVGLDKMPPFVRLFLGALVLGGGVFMGAKAVKDADQEKAVTPVGGSDPASGSSQQRPESQGN
jgi:hypothetical protein